ncbi:hypothetical protein COF45_25125 [Bacillus wiedmannii]|uniref:hypothetical protein n=1 Tax=Bacillus wiedmannii TaxID=1890302 RepID=UPI000BFC7011|nr:hypothetical protein [Bacillus wiedmannii]PHD06618.1 hypothetical protein COF45_25125 [Bacillus wiedmannii]
MEGTVTVGIDEAMKVMKENLKVGKEYKLKDIRSVLVARFPHINKNQVSGLMTRFTNGGTTIFEVRRAVGQRNTYVFTGGTEQADLGNEVVTVQDYVKHTIQTSIASLKKLSFGDIQSAEDFELLKNTEAKLQEMLENL